MNTTEKTPRYWFEVQTFTIADGWRNTWTGEDDQPEIFETQAEAEAALADFWDDIATAEELEHIARGSFDRSDYRIARVELCDPEPEPVGPFDVVCYGDGSTFFGQNRTDHIGTGGTLAWALAGRAYHCGHESPTVTIYDAAGNPVYRRKPTREQCASLLYRGAAFWTLIEEPTCAR